MPNFDFKLLRELADEMQRLAAIPASHKDYAVAQTALADLRTDYLAMKDEYQRQYATDPANPQRALATPEQTEVSQGPPDLGAFAAGSMAFSKVGLPFGLAEMLAATQPGISMADVQEQTAVMEKEHPTAKKIGTGVGVAAALITPRAVLGAGTAVAKAQTARIAAKKAAMEFEEKYGRQALPTIWSKVRGFWQGAKSARQAAAAAKQTAGAVAPTSSVAAKVAAEKAVMQTTQLADEAGQQLAASLAKAQAEELAAQATAKTAALVRQGFSQADAAEMVAQGINVPKALWMPGMRTARIATMRNAATTPLPPR